MDIVNQFCQREWCNSSDDKKNNIIKETILFEQEKISNSHIDIDVNLKRFSKIHISFDGIGNNIRETANGSTTGYKIRLNDNIMPKENGIVNSSSDNNAQTVYGIDTYITLMHEIQHVFQKFLINESKRLFASQSLKDFVKPLIINNKDKVKLNFANLKSGSLNFHVIQGEKNSYATRISNMLYTLSPMERDAFNTGITKGNLLIKKWNSENNNEFIPYRKNNVDIQIKEFKERYNCSHLLDNDVALLVDKCFENVCYNRKPNGKLEESVMYDISCVAAVMGYNIDQEYCNHLLDKKDEYLIDNQYAIVIDPDIVCETDYLSFRAKPEKFGTFSIEQQIKNTKLAIHIAALNLDDLIPCIKNIDAMRCYCMENIKDVLSVNNAKDGITNLFGCEFYEELKNINEKFPNIPMNVDIYEKLIDVIKLENVHRGNCDDLQNNSVDESLIPQNEIVEHNDEDREI